MKKRIMALFLLSIVFILTLTDCVFAVQYQYDALHRLVKVEYDDGSSVSYTYDGNGNITTTTVQRAAAPECEHVFTYQVDPIYLASPATATRAATYYYSCALCGETDRAHTFSYGEPLEAPQTPVVVSKSWSWHIAENPSATLTLLWSDGSSKSLTAAIHLVAFTNTELSYGASVTYDGVEYLSQKTVQRVYQVTLRNGVIASGEKKDGYSFGDKIIVQAKPTPGLAFAGWYVGDTLVSTAEVYGRCVTEDLILEARFAKEKVEASPVTSITDTARIYDSASGKYQTALVLDWSLPAGCTLVQVGMYRAYAQSPMTADEIAEFGTRSAPTAKSANGIYTLNISMGSGKKDYDLYYLGYVTYRDAKGQEKTVYTAAGCNKKI